MDRNSTAIVLAVVGVLACLCLALAVAGGGLVFTMWEAGQAFATEVGVAITEVSRPEDPTAAPTVVRTPVPTPPPGNSSTLEVLASEPIPEADTRLLAMRLKGIEDIPVVVSETPANHQIGDQVEFFASNTDTNVTFTVVAELIYATDNVYFFAEEGVPVNLNDVREVVDNFQNKTYPTNREFFGSEWNPGVDGDPHVYILYARGLGNSVAGYYSFQDEYSRLAHEFSNEKEMFYINADNQVPGDPYLDGVLAHEFQHMIHWYQDRNEDSWINEGASELASFLNGYGAGFEEYFLYEPDVQLNTWPEENTEAHYGAGFLFLAYFLDRFGEDATKALVAHGENGMLAVDEVLTDLGATDPATGQPITAIDVFADWVIANYLGEADAADGRYEYHLYPDAPTVPGPTDDYSCSASTAENVSQFAADYYEIDCEGEVTLTFTGSQQVQVVPTMPHSGRYAFWSHRNDESATSMTQAFDFTGLDTVTLTYWAWWEIEADYDFAYLEISTDGGETWTILETPSGTDYNPTGNAFGWGYTDNSGGGRRGEWIQETVDLSAYAGQPVMLRFEYITDGAVNRAGLMIDDIAIPELGYASDFEDGDGGWNGEGFVRMDNLLPQDFLVQVIQEGDETTVQRLELDEQNQGSLTVNIGGGDEVTLVVSGITPFTTEPASYEVSIE